MLRLHDTGSGRVVEAIPDDRATVSMYVCGPTVYGDPHLGHGRFALVFDVLRRYLEWKGHAVRHVSNITDVDDKIIERAAEEGCATDEIVARYESSWWAALDALGVLRPTEDPHATAYVDRMVELIGELVSRGVAYETGDGVYFASEQIDGYGLLARQSLDSLRAGARVDVADEKRSPVDFALWKKAKPGEPSWPSPWGDGRPGWHTECVVMSLDLLGDEFDIHGGGQDLAFPHHENERAQAVALGKPFARFWVHNGFVEVGGEKMSKSLGNFTNLADLLASADARAYRLLVLRAHYRSPVEVTAATAADADAALRRLDEFAARTAHLPATAVDPTATARFRELMDDDLDTPGVVALLFETVRRGNVALDAGDETAAATARATVLDLAAAVGLPLRAPADVRDEAAAGLVAARDEARAARDFARADAIRDELVAAGWVVEDTPQGTRIRRG